MADIDDEGATAHRIDWAAFVTPPPPAPPDVGLLRVRVLEAEGLPRREDGSVRVPFAAVAVNELTRRRTRRTCAKAAQPLGSSRGAADGGSEPTGPERPGGCAASWGEAFEFEGTGAAAQVVVDLWDAPAGSGDGARPRPAVDSAELLGKAVLSVAHCRPGAACAPRALRRGRQLALRLLFDFAQELPKDDICLI